LTVLRALRDASIALADVVTELARRGVEGLRVVLETIFDHLEDFTELLGALHDVATDTLATVLAAAFDAGATVLEFVGHALEQTYRISARLVEAALAATLDVATLLEAVVGETYWEFRQIVDGILAAAGPVGDILDWVLTRAEDAVDDLWHDALLAIRFAGGALVDALEWAANATDEAFEAIVRAWESIGEDLIDLYRWAAGFTGQIWELLGTVTYRIGNSVTYVLHYLEDDFLPGIRDFVVGLLRANYAVAELVVRLGSIAVGAAAEAVSAILEFGVDLADLAASILEEPSETIAHLVEALREAGRTVEAIFRAVADAGEDAFEALTDAFLTIGESVETVLNAVLEIKAGYIGLVLSRIASRVNTYRELTREELEAARDVFADSIDLEDVRITTEPTGSVIFAVQTWVRENLGDAGPDADPRPFTTMTIINTDPSEELNLPTLIHELTHVWQGVHDGPIYLSEAVHAQTLGGGYDYGHADPPEGRLWGEGGASALNRASGLDDFNREQQASIIEHYYVRKNLSEPHIKAYLTDELGSAARVPSSKPTGAWEPYAREVRQRHAP
jgi:hypothetical protein